jgi:hypothetical protein
MHHKHTNPHHRTTMIWLGLMFLLILMALLMALPSRAGAAPLRDRGLTVAAAPNQITAGQGVLIYGRLLGPGHAHRRIILFHRLAGAPRFTPISVARTDSAGFYEFVRADGIVATNRDWFVRGPAGTHSRTVNERVASVVTLGTAASLASASTSQTLRFVGTVTPLHPHQRVLLQRQSAASGNGWKTIAAGYTGAHSHYAISHRFRAAGSYTLRALFPSDPRNRAGQSASLTLTVQQQQNPSFTIDGSAATIADGQSATISGTLYASGSNTPVANVPVTLYGRALYGGRVQALASSTTNGSGAYSFTVMPVRNTVYHVVAASPAARTANLFLGVQDVVSAALSSATATVGAVVEVTGTVTPGHPGHRLYLQAQAPDGQWSDIATRRLSRASTFAFHLREGQPGALSLRVQIGGGPWNVGAVSASLPLTVSGLAPVSSLPQAS